MQHLRFCVLILLASFVLNARGQVKRWTTCPSGTPGDCANCPSPSNDIMCLLPTKPASTECECAQCFSSCPSGCACYLAQSVEPGSYECTQNCLPSPAPNNQVPAPSSQAPAPNNQVPAPNNQVPAPNNQVPAPSSQAPAPNTQIPVPSNTPQKPPTTVPSPAPNNQVPAPNNQVPAPNNQVPAPNNQVPAPNNQVPAPNNQVPAPNNQVPAPNNQVPAPSSQAPAPNTQIPAPSNTPQKPPTGVPAPNNQVPAPNNQVPAPSTHVPAPNNQVPAPNTQIPAPSNTPQKPPTDVPSPANNQIPAPSNTPQKPPSGVIPAPSNEQPAPSPNSDVACPLIKKNTGLYCGNTAAPTCPSGTTPNPLPVCVQGQNNQCIFERACLTPTTTCSEQLSVCGNSQMPSQQVCPNGFIGSPKCCCVTQLSGNLQTTSICKWTYVCNVTNPCPRCDDNPCSEGTERLLGTGVCVNDGGNCKTIGSTCLPPPTKCDCANVQRKPCPVGTINKNPSNNNCYADGLNCIWNVTCSEDPCWNKKDRCSCTSAQCQWIAGSIAANSGSISISGCVTPTSDVKSLISGLSFTQEVCSDVQPATVIETEKPAEKAATSFDNAVKTNIKPALDKLASELRKAQSGAIPSCVSKTTGQLLGKDFSMVLVATGSPSANSDGTVDFNAFVSFIPLGVTETVTNEHTDCFCVPIQEFIASLSGLKITDLGNCKWSLSSQKRALQESTGGSVSTTAESSAVDKIYGSPSSGSGISVGVFVLVVMMLVLLSL